MDFDTAFAQFLENAAQDMGKDFTITRDTLVEGRWVAMDARFNMSFERKPFGLIPTGNFTHSHEICLFIPMKTVQLAGLEELLAYLAQVQERQVKLDKWHEFTMLTLVIATEHADKDAIKALRKHQDERQYKVSGWSSARVVVANLSDGKSHCNKHGKPAQQRLQSSLKRITAK